MTTIAAPVRAPGMRIARAVRQLATIEGARLLRHPIVLASALLSIAFAIVFERNNEYGGDYFVLIGPAALPLGFGTLIAANLAALRSERSDTGELYGSLASPAEVRTVAHLVSVAWTAAACTALVGLGVLVHGAWQGLVVTPGGTSAVPSVFELAQGPVAVAVLGVIGVALARWLPYLPVAPVVGVGLLAAEVPFAMWNSQASYAWLAPVVNPAVVSGSDSSWPCFADQAWPCLLDRFASTEVGWHLLFLAGVGVVAAALALYHDAPRPRFAFAASAGLAVAVVGAFLQIP